jgi:N-acetylglucosamine malate deacetylase 1
VNVLVIAPHPDDEAIGCGGAIARHADDGDRVHAAFLTSGELALKHLPKEEARRVRESEAREAAAILGIAELSFIRRPDWTVGDDLEGAANAIAGLLERDSPDAVYVPHAHEWHPDHRAAWAALRQALDRVPRPAEIFAYEVWTPLRGWEVARDITDVMPRKLEAIERYESQRGPFDYVRAAKGLGQYRGALAAHCEYAEVFDGTLAAAEG